MRVAPLLVLSLVPAQGTWPDGLGGPLYAPQRGPTAHAFIDRLKVRGRASSAEVQRWQGRATLVLPIHLGIETSPRYPA